MKFFQFLQRPWHAPASLALLLLPAIALAAPAADGVLLKGTNAIQVSTHDVEQELSLLPDGQRAAYLADIEALRNVIDMIYQRRVLAAQALAKKLDREPMVQLQLTTLRDNVLAQSMIQTIRHDAIPSSAAVERLALATYQAEPERFKKPQSTRARHILIRGTDEAAHQQAQELWKQLKSGANFETLAKEHSQDKANAAKGGDLGFFGPGKMVPAFEQAVDALAQPGDFSAPVKTQFGWHLIQLEERVPASSRSFAEVRDELSAEIITKAQNDAQGQAMQKIRQASQGDETLLEAFMKAHQAKTPPSPAAADAQSGQAK